MSRAYVFLLACLASRAMAEPLPRIVVLATGGTIASRFDPTRGGIVPAAITGADIVQAVPDLGKIARIEVEQISNISSTEMTPDIWRKLALRVNTLLTDGEVAGVVVIHGTDTMEETAYFLDLTVTSARPVVLVGAQRAATSFDSDGPRNLLNAVRVAISPEAVAKGVLVVMNGKINAAREVTKTSTTDVETFKTVEFGALGMADNLAVRFYRTPTRRQTIPLREQDRLGRIEIVNDYAGADGRLIRLLLRDGNLDGLVVAGTGLGHVSEKTHDAINEARERGIPVVISTRVYTGRVLPLYADKGGGIVLRQIGCVLADNLSPQKARILLMLALTRTKSYTELQAYFDR
jgi:L-asparaginase